jgi:hypothetical protein
MPSFELSFVFEEGERKKRILWITEVKVTGTRKCRIPKSDFLDHEYPHSWPLLI